MEPLVRIHAEGGADTLHHIQWRKFIVLPTAYAAGIDMQLVRHRGLGEFLVMAQFAQFLGESGWHGQGGSRMA